MQASIRAILGAAVLAGATLRIPANVTGDSGIVTGLSGERDRGDSGIVTADSCERDHRSGHGGGTTVYATGTVLRMNQPRAGSLTAFLQELHARPKDQHAQTQRRTASETRRWAVPSTNS